MREPNKITGANAGENGSVHRIMLFVETSKEWALAE